jgi:hypothetical protein
MSGSERLGTGPSVSLSLCLMIYHASAMRSFLQKLCMRDGEDLRAWEALCMAGAGVNDHYHLNASVGSQVHDRLMILNAVVPS